MKQIIHNTNLRLPLKIETRMPNLRRLGKAGTRMRLEEALLVHHGGNDWTRLTKEELAVLRTIAVETDSVWGMTQRRAITALGHVRDAESLRLLRRLSRSHDGWIRGAAKSALRDRPCVPDNLDLDRHRGQRIQIGQQVWMFFANRVALKQWTKLGCSETALGVVAHVYDVLDLPEDEYLIISTPAIRGLRLEMRKLDGTARFKARGELQGGALHFAAHFGRRGELVGMLSQRGKITLTKARLPRPVGKSPTPDPIHRTQL